MVKLQKCDFSEGVANNFRVTFCFRFTHSLLADHKFGMRCLFVIIF